MNMQQLIESIKQHRDYGKVGMILCHNGVVRETARDGRPVTGLRVSVNESRLHAVIEKNRQRAGIVDILVDIAADRELCVGDDVMHLVVAGDIRENVIDCLRKTLDEIKSTVTRKTEYFVTK